MSTVRPKESTFVGTESGPVWLDSSVDWPAEDPLVRARPELFTAPVEPVREQPQQRPRIGRQAKPDA